MANRQSTVTLKFLAEPSDVNLYGNVHGGSVMKWIDQAGYACSVGWCGNFCVTVFVSGIRFYRPIHIGHLVEVTGRLIYTGRTSMHIAVEVKAADPRDGQYTRTTQCIVVFVAIDADGKPVEVPAWEPKTGEEKSMRDYAIRLMELRKGIEAQAGPLGASENGAA